MPRLIFHLLNSWRVAFECRFAERVCSNAVLVLLLLSVAGCSLFNTTAQDKTALLTTKSGVDVVSYTGSLRGAYVLPENSKVKFCAEPAPDVSLDTLKEISANLKATAESIGSAAKPSIEGGIDSKITTKALELQGRTALVILARDLLYRLCELSINNAPESQAYEKAAVQYSQVLDVIVRLAKAEQDLASADLLRAQQAAFKDLDRAKVEAARILAHVTKSDGTIDSALLAALANQMPSATKGLKKDISLITNVSELREFLEDSTPQVVFELAAGIP